MDKTNLSWQTWAKTNQLDYYSSGITKSVSGTYLGHYLKLCQTYYNSIRVELVQNAIQDGSHSDIERFLGEAFGAEKLAKLLTDDITLSLKGSLSIKEISGTTFCYYEQFSLENNFDYLHPLLNLLANLINVYPAVSTLGGQVIPALRGLIVDRNHPLRDIALSLLRNIERKTKEQFDDQILCSFCYSRWTSYEESIPGELGPIQINYYGCRKCGRSKNPLYGKKVIATLNSKMGKKPQEQGEVLRVNWLAYRAMFDFNEVEIIQATDEDVERFVVQVGNELDEIRVPIFKSLRCAISPDCELSENTTRILHKMFEVTVQESLQQ